MTEWTRADLPDVEVIADRMANTAHMTWEVRAGCVLEEVLGHLNAHYPKPEPDHKVPWKTAALNWEIRADRAERERDAAVARAEQAERERDEEKRQHTDTIRVAGEQYLDLQARLSDAQKNLRDEMDRHDTLRNKVAKEAVDAVNVPTVSRADIEKCVYGSRRAGRECDKQGFVPVHVQEAVDQLCALFGVEAEQAVDPVEEQTDALADILYGHEMVTDQMRGVLERVVRAGMLFPGQEASSDE